MEDALAEWEKTELDPYMEEWEKTLRELVEKEGKEDTVAHRIEYSPETEAHLRALTAGQRSLVLSSVEKQLPHQPTVETRNRKPMRPNLLATWELRVRNLWVYYTVDEEPEPVVSIRAVGVKVGNRVRIADQEIDL